jgi:hypothetical protein
MAVRTPIYLNGSTPQEMTAAMVSAIQTRAVYEFMNSPSVTLSYIASGGNLGTIANDTRLQAGVAIVGRPNAPATEAETAEPTTVTVAYSTVNQNITSGLSAPVDTASLAFPLYWNGSGLQAMTLTDVYDTFVFPAINTLVTANQLYTIGTTTPAGYTAVSGSPIFIDTKADLTQYTAIGIPEPLDQPVVVDNYYLYSKNNTAAPTFTNPMYAGSNYIQEFGTAAFTTLLANAVRFVAANTVGYRIRFNFGGAGTNTGSVTDTFLSGGAGNYQTLNAYYIGGTRYDYRAQEFPDGTLTTTVTHMKVQKV